VALDQSGRRKRLVADQTKYSLVRSGDLAYNAMRMWQGAVGASAVDGLVSSAYVVITPRPGTDPNFFEFLFRTTLYKQQVNRYSTGIASDRNRLYWEHFKQMPNVLVPLHEQEAICRFIQTETGAQDLAISRLQREIELLRELRARLVADLVTGKVDVREAAARLPEEAPADIVGSDGELGDEVDTPDEETGEDSRLPTAAR
jgi:type I restriction enzyme S subunit